MALTMTAETTIRTFTPPPFGGMPLEAPVTHSKRTSFKEGDVLLITATNAEMKAQFGYRGNATKGDLVTVKEASEDSFYIVGEEGKVSHWISSEHAEFVHNFKVGDKVRAKDGAPYSVTTDGWTGTVSALLPKPEPANNMFKGEMVYRNHSIRVGDYLVDPKYFELVVEPEFKAGDRVLMVDTWQQANGTNHYAGKAQQGGTYTVLSVHHRSVILENDKGYYLDKKHIKLADEPKVLKVDLEAEPLWFVEPIKVRDPSDFTWSELTDEEKGDLLLAHHEGKRIQAWQTGNGNGAIHTWWTVPACDLTWSNHIRYRVFTPEMEEAERKAKVATEISDLRSKIADLEATIH